jgi:hypothetical protein
MASNSSDLNRSPLTKVRSHNVNSQPQLVGKWLGAQKDLQKLAPILAELSVYQRELDKAYPLLMLKAISLKDDLLVVAAPSPSVAAKLRQSTPSLLAAINVACEISPDTRGRKVNRIRFKPQMGFSAGRSYSGNTKNNVNNATTTSQVRYAVTLPAESITIAQHIIEECGNEKLKLALTRLLKLQQKKSAQSMK